MINKPLVSICTVAFNHENYIEKMIQSILNQKTNFDYELLIHDDASLDATTDIIKKYTIKYPNIIKPIFQKENQFSQGIRPNIEYNIPRAEGKYLAFCDGDDYWCDPLKLQKQIDFLETNLEFSGCTHNTKISRERVENKSEEELVVYNPQKDIYTIEDFTKGEAYFHTTAYIFRFNENKKNYILELSKQIRGDWFRSILFASFGPIKYLDEVMSVYRIHDKGIWSELSEQEQVMKNLDAIFKINKAFDYAYEENFMQLFARVFITSKIDKSIDTLSKLFKELSKEELVKIIFYLNQYANKQEEQALYEKEQMQKREQHIQKIQSSFGWKVGSLIDKLRG
jgi:glycosyltransferase involved in cell wall biosynthesis